MSWSAQQACDCTSCVYIVHVLQIGCTRCILHVPIYNVHVHVHVHTCTCTCTYMYIRTMYKYCTCTSWLYTLRTSMYMYIAACMECMTSYMLYHTIIYWSTTPIFCILTTASGAKSTVRTTYMYIWHMDTTITIHVHSQL